MRVVLVFFFVVLVLLAHVAPTVGIRSAVEEIFTERICRSHMTQLFSFSGGFSAVKAVFSGH